MDVAAFVGYRLLDLVGYVGLNLTRLLVRISYWLSFTTFGYMLIASAFDIYLFELLNMLRLLVVRRLCLYGLNVNSVGNVDSGNIALVVAGPTYTSFWSIDLWLLFSTHYLVYVLWTS